MRINIPVYGNLNMIATLKKLGVALMYSRSGTSVLAIFDHTQAPLYECTKDILARQVARTVGLQKQA